MAVHNKPVPKPSTRPASREAPQQRAVSKSAPQNQGILKSARDVFSGKTVQKQTHAANATYVRGRPQSPLAAVTKSDTTSSPSMISHGNAVDYLNNFLAKSRKA